MSDVEPFGTQSPGCYRVAIIHWFQRKQFEACITYIDRGDGISSSLQKKSVSLVEIFVKEVQEKWKKSNYTKKKLQLQIFFRSFNSHSQSCSGTRGHCHSQSPVPGGS